MARPRVTDNRTDPVTGGRRFGPAPDHQSTSTLRACDQAERLLPLDLLSAP